MIAEAEALYGALPAGDDRALRAGEPKQGAPGFRYRELAGDIRQSQLAFGWRTPGTLHADTPALDLARGGARRGSRRRASTAPCASGSSRRRVGAYDYTPTELGVFVVHAETPPETRRDALRRDLGPGAARARRARSASTSSSARSASTRRAGCAGSRHGGAGELPRVSGRRSATGGSATRTSSRADAARRRRPCARRRGSGCRRRTPRCSSTGPTSAPRVAADAPAMRAIARGAVPSRRSSRRARSGARRRSCAGAAESYARKPGCTCIARPRRRADPRPAQAGLAARAPRRVRVGGATRRAGRARGLTLLMARTAASGSERRSALQIAEEAELLGGSVGAAVAGDSFGWSISVPRSTWRRRSSCSPTSCSDPAFPGGRARDRARGGDRGGRRDARRHVPLSAAPREQRPRTRAIRTAAPSAGTEESLAAITRDDVARLAPRQCPARRDGDRGRRRRGSRRDAARVAGAFAALRRAPRLGAAAPPGRRRRSRVVEPREEGAERRSRCCFPGPGRTRRRPVRGVAPRRDREWPRRPLLRRAARQALALLHGAHVSRRARGRPATFVAYIATSPEKEAAARAGCSTSSESSATVASPPRSSSARRPTRSACTRSGCRAAARCSARSSTRSCSGRWPSSIRSTPACAAVHAGRHPARCAPRTSIRRVRVEAIVRGAVLIAGQPAIDSRSCLIASRTAFSAARSRPLGARSPRAWA